MTMKKWLIIAVAAASSLWMFCAPLAAQNANQIVNSVRPTDLIQIMRGNSGAIFYATPATVVGGGSIISGMTPCTGCASGGVVYNNGGVLTADSGLTKAAGATGLVTAGGGINAAQRIATSTTVLIGAGNGITPGGSTAIGINFANVANFGIFVGSGAPTISAAQGSLYLRSDGTSTTRAYINVDGSTTWTAITTAG